MSINRRKIASAVLAGLLLGASSASGVSPSHQFTGSIAGLVTDVTGVPQMGATVLLFNRYERLIQRVLTNEKGVFGFDSIAPDFYSVRVSLSSFVPAMKRNISVQPGVRSFLSINMASIFSSVELVYSIPGQTGIMSDDWKWVLRSSLSTRPVLRFLPSDTVDLDPSSRQKQSMFSQTRGVLRLSASDLGAVSAFSSEPDLGTAFALATSVYGSNPLQFSGNFGYSSQAGTPAAGFRTGFTPTIMGTPGPEVNIMVRQLFLPARAGSAFVSGQHEGSPGLRTMSLSLSEKRKITEELEVAYGLSLESVVFFDRLNFLSPYLALDYSIGNAGVLSFGYVSGVPPTGTLVGATQPEAEFTRELAALSAFPRVSRRDGAVHVQRMHEYEFGYRKSIGNTTIGAGVYRESISNAALSMQAPAGYYSTSELLPDPFSSSSIFNIGTYERTGVTASVTQNIGDQMSAGVAYGSSGAIAAPEHPIETNDPSELRSLLRSERRAWASAQFAGTSPWGGTKFAASYKWTDYSVLAPSHRSLTQRVSADPGLNIQVRQPIGSVPGFSGRLEASAEIRNLLEQGYLPITTANGKRLLLVQSPRALRGSLSFIF